MSAFPYRVHCVHGTFLFALFCRRLFYSVRRRYFRRVCVCGRQTRCPQCIVEAA